MSDKEDIMTNAKFGSEPVSDKALEADANHQVADEGSDAGLLEPEQTAEIPLEIDPLVETIKSLPDDEEDEEDGVVKEETLIAIESFEELGLSENLIQAINDMQWTKPTLIQGLCLPQTIRGQDVAGFAQTGTGKTGVFLITIAHQLLKLREASAEQTHHPKALILAPTRELAVQIASDAELLLNKLNISCLPVFGGVDYEKQAAQIKKGVDVIVATPGRLKDYFQKRIFSTKECCLFICDEADRMLDMGFIEDVEFFLGTLSPETQKLLFSATTNDKVKELAFEYLESPKYISANPEVITPERIEQHAVICDSTQKLQVMLGLLAEHKPVCSVVFTNTKIVAEWLQYKLTKNGIECDLITGDLPQKKRITLINRIKAGEVKALIATDVASRGLHISGITHVYNFDLPDDAANYVHRIGRTARAGASGSAYSLVCEDYGHNLIDIEKYLGENVKIKTAWFPEQFLEIEDKAENPYKDPEFKGSRMSDKEDRRGDRRGGDKSRHPRHQKGEARSGAGSPDRPRGPRISARVDEKPAVAAERSEAVLSKGRKPDRGFRKDQVAVAATAQPAGKNRHRKAHMTGNPSPIQPKGKIIIKPVQKEAPSGFFGLIKKIFAVFFGRKS